MSLHLYQLYCAIRLMMILNIPRSMVSSKQKNNNSELSWHLTLSCANQASSNPTQIFFLFIAYLFASDKRGQIIMQREAFNPSCFILAPLGMPLPFPVFVGKDANP